MPPEAKEKARKAAAILNCKIEEYEEEKRRGKLGFGLNTSSEFPTIEALCPSYVKLSDAGKKLVTQELDEKFSEDAESLDSTLQGNYTSWKSADIIEKQAKTDPTIPKTDERFAADQKRESKADFEKTIAQSLKAAEIKVNVERENLASNPEKMAELKEKFAPEPAVQQKPKLER